jgi:DnaJ-class molecular chaperone
MRTKMGTQQEHTGRISNLTTKVHDLLITDTRYRDDDNLLVNRVQKDELANMGLNPANVTVYDFFRFRLNKQITDEDTITRARRKVQELNPETRGDKYKIRQSRQIEVQLEIKNIKPNQTNAIMCLDCNGKGIQDDLFTNEDSHCLNCNGTGYLK